MITETVQEELHCSTDGLFNLGRSRNDEIEIARHFHKKITVKKPAAAASYISQI